MKPLDLNVIPLIYFTEGLFTMKRITSELRPSGNSASGVNSIIFFSTTNKIGEF